MVETPTSVQLLDPVNFSIPIGLSKLPIESLAIYGNSPTSSPWNLSAGFLNSPISEFLIYPTAVNRMKPKPVSISARILTSSESHALLEENKEKEIGGRK